MSNFKNVNVTKKANVYFDGAVTSRTIHFPDGETKTLGIMMPGDYTFGTEKKEIMEILAGDVDILLPGEDEWRQIGADQVFEVPANSSFQIKVKSLTDYCCSYIDES
jgi:uncharacterized protein YaiE (UPF0345 family)